MISLVALLCNSCVRPPSIPEGDAPIHAENPIIGLPTVQAWSNKDPLQLGVDTGATQPAIFFSPSVKELGGKLRGRPPMQMTSLPISLSKGGKPLEEKTEVAVVTSAPYDGLLGWGTIQRFIWHLNIPKQHHDFYNVLPKQVKKWDKIPLVSNTDYLQILNPNGKLTIIDTGAPHTVYISRKRWARFKEDYPDAFVSVYSGYSPAAGGYYAYECMNIKSFRVGSLVLNNVIACESFIDKQLMGINHEIDLMLGLDAMKEHSFWIDSQGKSLYFKKVADASGSQQTYNLVGAAFIPSPDGSPPLTAKISEWSPAWNAGLRTGDIIVAINGRLRPNESLIEYVTTQEGARATIAFRRKGRLYTAEWTVPPRPIAGEFHPTPPAVTAEEYQRIQLQEQQMEEQKQQSPPNAGQPLPPAKNAPQPTVNQSPLQAPPTPPTPPVA